MANNASSKKRIRKIQRQTAVNRRRVSTVRTFVRKVEQAIASGDKQAAETALRQAEPLLARAGQTKVIHPNTASRKVSRLAKRVGQMGAP
jgi:small subunit ribosomal protein S20